VIHHRKDLSTVKRIALAAAASIAAGILAVAPTAHAVPGDAHQAHQTSLSAATWIRIANIQRGSTGEGVRCVQFAVNNLWAHLHSGQRILDEDGIFGKNTEDGVMWFQDITDNEMDGVVGPDTGTDIIIWDDARATHCRGYVPHD
jgi:peptidoglycan hydrolase-like protein with peptidoglycan-binding domain